MFNGIQQRCWGGRHWKSNVRMWFVQNLRREIRSLAEIARHGSGSQFLQQQHHRVLSHFWWRRGPGIIFNCRKGKRERGLRCVCARRRRCRRAPLIGSLRKHIAPVARCTATSQGSVSHSHSHFCFESDRTRQSSTGLLQRWPSKPQTSHTCLKTVGFPCTHTHTLCTVSIHTLTAAMLMQHLTNALIVTECICYTLKNTTFVLTQIWDTF